MEEKRDIKLTCICESCHKILSTRIVGEWIYGTMDRDDNDMYQFGDGGIVKYSTCKECYKLEFQEEE